MTKFDRLGSSSSDADYYYLPGSWKRYKRTLGGTTEYYVYDGDNVIASYASNGTLNRSYVTPGLDANLSMTSSNNTYYYFNDALGTVRNLVDANEVAQNTYDYRAFGENISATENITSPYRFTGRDYEPGGISQAHYYRNRYYMPWTGIFMSRDAFEYDTHQGWGYVGNLPTIRVDPYGLADCCEEEEYDKETQCCVDGSIVDKYLVCIRCGEGHCWIAAKNKHNNEDEHSYGRWRTGYGGANSSGVQTDIEKGKNRKYVAERCCTTCGFTPTINKGYEIFDNNCVTYARSEYKRVCGEDLESRYGCGFGWDSPTTMIDSITSANGGDSSNSGNIPEGTPDDGGSSDSSNRRSGYGWLLDKYGESSLGSSGS